MEHIKPLEHQEPFDFPEEGATIERIRFETWAKNNEFDLSKEHDWRDQTNLPAYQSEDTWMAWMGWFARSKMK